MTVTGIPPEPQPDPIPSYRDLMYDYVYDKRTGERILLDSDADTATMRENMKVEGGPIYIGVYGTLEVEVTPCGGSGKRVKAYWRGDEGNEARKKELQRQAKANAEAHHTVPESDNL